MRQPLVQICLTGDMSIDYRVHKTALSLINDGFEVYCISRYKPGFGQTASMPYQVVILPTCFKAGILFYLEFNVRLFFYLLLHGSRVVLSIDLDTLTGCRLATWIRRRPLVFDSHEYFPEVPEVAHRTVVKSIWLLAEKLFIPTVDKAYTVCSSIANIYTDKYRKHFDVVRNLPLASRQEIMTKAIDDERFVILYQGAINMGRGILETLDAMLLVDNVLLVIIGDGDQVAEVRCKIDQLKLHDKVHMLGKIPFSQLPAYTCSANAGLCLLENRGLNYYYSLPNRVFDFALAGVPIIASDFPEISAVVGGYGTGVLVQDLKPQSIVNAINRLKDDAEFYQLTVKNALSASKKLVWEKEESVLKAIFQSLK